MSLEDFHITSYADICILDNVDKSTEFVTFIYFHFFKVKKSLVTVLLKMLLFTCILIFSYKASIDLLNLYWKS